MIDHKDIQKIVPIEFSGLNDETVMTLPEREDGYKIIKNFVNEKTKHILSPLQELQKDGILGLGKLVNPEEMKKEIYRFPIYRGHIKNDLYSRGPAIEVSPSSIEKLRPTTYSWSMSDLLKCKTITDLASNPLIIELVSKYLGCLPTCYGINCMLSIGPTKGAPRGIAVRHRDQDDFKFLTLFVYLDDVSRHNGPHVYEIGTHLVDPLIIAKYLPNDPNATPGILEDVKERIITGKAGHAFIEDGYGKHHGMPMYSSPMMGLGPRVQKRTALWIRYGLYDNYTARKSVQISDHKADKDMFDMSTEINKYVFRFLT